MKDPKVALVHDDLIQWGGAERVLFALSEIFPDAPIYTSLFNEKNSLLRQKFAQRRIITSFLQNIPGKVSMYRSLLPFYTLAFEQFYFSVFDLVISQTTRFAKSIITRPQTLHIAYVHTPPRFLWNFSGDVQPAMTKGILSFLRVEDQTLSNRVDVFWAGSLNAQKRITKIYNRSSEILYPFVDLMSHSSTPAFDGGYYLVISRLVYYKRVDLAVEAFNKNGRNLKIVGRGPELKKLRRRAGSNIEFLSSVTDHVLLNLIAGAKAVIITAEEDFGLMPLEAQALGKSVIAYGKGGALETVIDGKTGVLFNQQTTTSLNQAIERFETLKILAEDCRHNAGRFSRELFELNLKKLVTQAMQSHSH